MLFAITKVAAVSLAGLAVTTALLFTIQSLGG